MLQPLFVLRVLSSGLQQGPQARCWPCLPPHLTHLLDAAWHLFTSLPICDSPALRSGAHGQLGHPQLHALHMMQVNAGFVIDQPRKLDSLDPFRLYPWKRWVK